MSNTQTQNQTQPNKQQINLQTRYANLYLRNSEHNRHQQHKKRFPPKKQFLFQRNHQIDKLRGKTFQTDPSTVLPTNQDTKPELKNVQFSRFIQNDISNSIQKANAIGALPSVLAYHPVGQSQRDKMISISPNPMSITQQNNNLKDNMNK